MKLVLLSFLILVFSVDSMARFSRGGRDGKRGGRSSRGWSSSGGGTGYACFNGPSIADKVVDNYGKILLGDEDQNLNTPGMRIYAKEHFDMISRSVQRSLGAPISEIELLQWKNLAETRPKYKESERLGQNVGQVVLEFVNQYKVIAPLLVEKLHEVHQKAVKQKWWSHSRYVMSTGDDSVPSARQKIRQKTLGYTQPYFIREPGKRRVKLYCKPVQLANRVEVPEDKSASINYNQDVFKKMSLLSQMMLVLHEYTYFMVWDDKDGMLSTGVQSLVRNLFNAKILDDLNNRVGAPDLLSAEFKTFPKDWYSWSWVEGNLYSGAASTIRYYPAKKISLKKSSDKDDVKNTLSESYRELWSFIREKGLHLATNRGTSESLRGEKLAFLAGEALIRQAANGEKFHYSDEAAFLLQSQIISNPEVVATTKDKNDLSGVCAENWVTTDALKSAAAVRKLVKIAPYFFGSEFAKALVKAPKSQWALNTSINACGALYWFSQEGSKAELEKGWKVLGKVWGRKKEIQAELDQRASWFTSTTERRDRVFAIRCLQALKAQRYCQRDPELAKFANQEQ